MPTCCLYNDTRFGSFRTLCTDAAAGCPTLGAGLVLVGSWSVPKCEDCKFDLVPDPAARVPGLLAAELSDVRVLLAEAQGRITVLARFGATEAGHFGLLERPLFGIKQPEVKEQKK